MAITPVSVTIDRAQKSVTPGLVMGQTLLDLAGVKPPEQLFLEVADDFDVPVAAKDGILIRGGETFSIGDGSPALCDNPSLREGVRFHLNKHPMQLPEPHTLKVKATGKELKQLDPNLRSEDALYADLSGLADEPIADDLRLILQPQDRFFTGSAQCVDVEECGKGGKEPPRAHHYRIRVDDDHFTVSKDHLTGREILELASKTPEQFALRQRLRGGKVESIAADDVVDLRKPGIERFSTIPKENTDGEGSVPSPRRDFALPEADTEYLDANFPGWEAIREGNQPYVILRSFPLPPGYTNSHSDMAIAISSGYPLAKLDMMNFMPRLGRTNGRTIHATHDCSIEGNSWQGWSRHYHWREGVDGLATHIERIKAWLEAELSR